MLAARLFTAPCMCVSTTIPNSQSVPASAVATFVQHDWQPESAINESVMSQIVGAVDIRQEEYGHT
jgi:hypothetical protein